MKYTLLALLGLSATSFGAISISGASASGFSTGSDGTGSAGLILFIMDNTGASGNGFLNGTLSGSIPTALTASSDPHLTSASSSTTVGGTFGGDLIIGRAGVVTPGQLPFTLAIDDQSFAGQGRNFAIVYFPTLTSAFTGVIPDGTTYGIIQGADWVLPTSDGSYTASATLANYNNVASVLARVTQSGGVLTNANFGSATAVFTVGIIPEPSTAVLGAIGALGLLRRRR